MESLSNVSRYFSIKLIANRKISPDSEGLARVNVDVTVIWVLFSNEVLLGFRAPLAEINWSSSLRSKLILLQASGLHPIFEKIDGLRRRWYLVIGDQMRVSLLTSLLNSIHLTDSSIKLILISTISWLTIEKISRITRSH